MVPFQRIVCPVDFSEPSHAALDTADELAVRCGAELCVVHVVPPVRMIYPLGPYPGFMNFEEPEYERVVCETAKKALSWAASAGCGKNGEGCDSSFDR